jgi:hypothetical protein
MEECRYPEFPLHRFSSRRDQPPPSGFGLRSLKYPASPVSIDWLKTWATLNMTGRIGQVARASWYARARAGIARWGIRAGKEEFALFGASSHR